MHPRSDCDGYLARLPISRVRHPANPGWTPTSVAIFNPLAPPKTSDHIACDVFRKSNPLQRGPKDDSGDEG